LLKGLRQAGLIVHDCSSSRKGILRYVSGLIKFLKFKRNSDIILVGFFGQGLVPIVRLCTSRKIIFDTYVSAYQTLAFDRKIIHPRGILATLIRFVEKLSCQLADVCLLDTEQHIEYFTKEYHLDRGKFRRSLVGAEYPDVGSTISETPEHPVIHFHGEFQPLHGVKVIVGAAKLLPGAKFRMIGSGRELNTCMNYCKALGAGNVEFIGSVPFEMLQAYIKAATICLGVFGDTEKTQLVIPLKVYEALAAAKPVITANTPAIRELLTHGKDVFLCNHADPTDLARAINTLLTDADLRSKIAVNGHRTFRERCTPEQIGQDIGRLCKEMLRN
jgi:glycosyltransferase involved in cell wall biosynthesis